MSATTLESPPCADPAEVGRFAARLAVADRSLQQEEGTLIVLRSWRRLWPCLLGAVGGDALLHLSAPVRLGLLLGILALILGTIARAVWVGCVRRSPPEHTARVLEARDPRLGSKLINILQLGAQAGDARLVPLTRELAAHAVAGSAAELALFDFQSLTATDRPRREAKRLGIALVSLLAIFGLGHDILRAGVPRFLDPFGDHPPYSFTRIDIVDPAADGASVIYGQNVLIAARTHGHRPGVYFSPSIRRGGRRMR